MSGKDDLNVELPPEITKPGSAKEISIGCLAGFCSGYATKKLSKKAGVALGAGFIGIQALNHTGLVTVHWDVLEKKLVKSLDQDNDGKLTQKDLNIVSARYLHLLTQDLPFAGGFAASFALGMKYG
ncbi:FUN14 family-domain-containing protein [Neocallimastix lanati (nom. inval.)]|uniref:EF-hand domain-containing protein n=1 Tax=Neocallimastix californiae TaxID=1754190 RepID=A0A1Y2AN52_9FUNG|nr:FUN14 family-domain-containing protein [Neocallimastix sp. JGI-2020a]ORY23730.1 hypothetical protein LY90DRAFT_389708 [Neocallimastix californiae]|eukprot:ORY23730.1 hypothetical protein LY90DRAFT_389708 [Neocallimastix californiae]